jgi:hypothetical protein
MKTIKTGMMAALFENAFGFIEFQMDGGRHMKQSWRRAFPDTERGPGGRGGMRRKVEIKYNDIPQRFPDQKTRDPNPIFHPK